MIRNIILILFFTLAPSAINAGNYRLNTPHFLSQKAYDSVKNFLDAAATIEPDHIVNDLHKKFSWVTKIECKKISQNKMIVTLEASEPFCLLGNQHYVAHNGSILSYGLLTQEYIEKLPSITLGSEKLFPVSLGEQLVHLAPSLLTHFNVVWNNKNSILLMPYKTDKPILLTTLERQINDDLMRHCMRIHTKLVSESTRKKKESYLLDIRFNKQIIKRKFTPSLTL